VNKPAGMPQPDAKALRTSILDLHRELLNSQVIEVERATGRAMGPNDILKSALEDPRFAWLRDLSGLAADLDAEISEAKSEGREPNTAASVERATFLIAPPDQNDPFGALYLRSLQRNPGVVMAHRDLLALIEPQQL
jgi:hypothetical protein